MLPHLDAAYNLARWLTRNDADAQDVVQDAYLRAFRFFPSFQGGSSRAWLLAIVRNARYAWMRRNRPSELLALTDETEYAVDAASPSAESELLWQARRESLSRCLEQLPLLFREIIVLRELEGMSYRELAEATELPLGTVMSRLARARKRLEQCMTTGAKGAAR